jgi:hypothetical protein
LNAEIARCLNDILDLAGYGSNLPQPNEVSRIFGLDEHSIFVKGGAVPKFDSAIDELLDSMPSLRATLSKERFIDELIPEIRRKKIQSSKFTEIECASLYQRISAIPLEKYRVLRRIYGVTLPRSTAPVDIGDFTIYDGKSHLGQIVSGVLNSQFLHWFKEPSGFVIECSVDARDDRKAVELADVLFHRFELIVRFVIGRRTTRFEVGVLNYLGPRMLDHIVIAKTNVSEGGAWQGALEPIPIADPIFSNPAPPFAKLFGLIRKQSNKFQVHVLRCAEWTAEAIGDANAASAFVKAAIALEVLFSITEKGVITPSIMAQIAESCAFILGDSPTSSAKVEHEVKRLYGVRSAIVHSGKDSVETQDLNALIQTCRDVVLVLLSRKEFENIDSMTMLAEQLKSKKYASVKASEN